MDDLIRQYAAEAESLGLMVARDRFIRKREGYYNQHIIPRRMYVRREPRTVFFVCNLGYKSRPTWHERPTLKACLSLKGKRDVVEPVSQAYTALTDARVALGETNDCGVVTLSTATGISYEAAHEALAKRGRKARCGTYMIQLLRAVCDLGYHTQLIPNVRFIHQTYGGMKNPPSTVTTKHPLRFPKHWPKGTFILETKKHVLTVKDGEVMDWSISRSLPVQRIFKVMKDGEDD